MTIIFKCDCCNMTMFGDKNRNHVDAHWKKVAEDKQIFIDSYYICDNCIEYDRKKYMEV